MENLKDNKKNEIELENNNNGDEAVENEKTYLKHDKKDLLDTNKQVETDDSVLNVVLYDEYLNKLILNNNLQEFSNFIFEINKYVPKIQAEYFEKVLDFFNENQLYMNAFYVRECLSYLDYYKIRVSNEHTQIIDRLQKTFLFYHFDYNDKNKYNEKMYLLRKEIMDAYINNKKASSTTLRELEDIIGSEKEIELYQVLNEFYCDEITSVDDAKKVLKSIEDYIFKYPDEQTTIILYYYICYIYEIDPSLKSMGVRVRRKGKSVVAEIDFERIYEIKLPYVNYYIAVMLFTIDNYQSAKLFLDNEKLLPRGHWDEKVRIIQNNRKVDNVIMKRIMMNAKIKRMVMWAIMTAVFACIMYLVVR